MKLGEKIKEELKDLLPRWCEKGKEGTWSCGFRIGFRRGYAFAYEEATKMLKGIKPEIE